MESVRSLPTYCKALFLPIGYCLHSIVKYTSAYLALHLFGFDLNQYVEQAKQEHALPNKEKLASLERDGVTGAQAISILNITLISPVIEELWCRAVMEGTVLPYALSFVDMDETAELITTIGITALVCGAVHLNQILVQRHSRAGVKATWIKAGRNTILSVAYSAAYRSGGLLSAIALHAGHNCSSIRSTGLHVSQLRIFLPKMSKKTVLLTGVLVLERLIGMPIALLSTPAIGYQAARKTLTDC